MDVYNVLKSLNISYEETNHKTVATVKEAKIIRNKIDGTLCKNLFLTDKKGSYYLVMLESSKRANIKELSRLVNKSHLVFASVKDLKDILKLERGSVTPLGIINDKEIRVKIIIDKDLVGKKILVHPCINTKTISMSYDDLIRFIKYEKHDFVLA